MSHETSIRSPQRGRTSSSTSLVAGSAPVPALDRLPPHVRGHRLLPHLRHRRSALSTHQRTTSARPNVPAESPTTNRCDFALVTMLGLLGLRIFEATGSDIEDLGEEQGHRVFRVRGKGDKVVLVPLPPAVGRAIERSIEDRTAGPILLTGRGTRMDRHCATRRLRRRAEEAGVKLPRMHPHMLGHTFVITMLDAAVDLRDVQIAALTPIHAPPCATTVLARTSTGIPTTSSPPTWPPAPEPSPVMPMCGQ